MGKLLRVLIVEDSEDDAALLVRELRRGGYKIVSERVETAGTMDSALALAEWDAILSDYSMPNFSAPRALEVLKNRNLDIPFIIVSGTIGEETAVDALKAGAQDFLVKGRLARLVPAIERELREAQNRREHRRAESALRESEERFRQIAETIDEVFWMADPQTSGMLYMSPAYERVWGRSLANLYKNPTSFLESIHPDDRTGVLAVFEAEKTGQTFQYEYRIVRPDGAVRWIWDRGFPVHSSSGQVTRYVGVAVDITERKRAEEENARLAMIVNSSEDAILSVGSDEVIATWNAGAERMYGYTAEEITGKHVSILIPEERRKELEPNSERLASGEALVHYEHVNQRKDGTKFPVLLTLSPIKDARGAFTGVSVIARDITEIKQLEEQFRQAQKMEAVGRLAGGVAHDFNNLLTIINGYSEMMLERAAAGDPSRGQLEEIQKAGIRAAALTRQLLAFSRQQVLVPQVLHLNAIVTDVEKMLRRLIGEDIELDLALDRELGRVKADAGQLDQILVNLAVNARDAMPQGGRLTIATANAEFTDAHTPGFPVVRPGHYVMLSVSDTGIGMDAATQAHIFEPFYTTKGEGKGTGLGLSMVYGTVKQSGGFIWVYSELGQGATFRIYLPWVDEVAGPVQSAEARGPSVAGTETILLLEDEEAVRGLASRVLHAYGYQVIECTSPENALRIAAQHKETIHLLLTDVVLPRMNGRQVAERLAQVRPGIRVLYMSGYTDDSILHCGVLNAQTAFLQKPFTTRELAGKVREVLDHQGANSQT